MACQGKRIGIGINDENVEVEIVMILGMGAVIFPVIRCSDLNLILLFEI